MVGNRLFVGSSDGSVSCWDSAESRKFWVLRGPSDGVRRLALAGNVLYVCSKHGKVRAFQFEADSDASAAAVLALLPVRRRTRCV
jgi:hypothetical protein